MSFIYKIIGPDEKLLGVAHLHWIYIVKAISWLFAGLVVGLGFDWMISQPSDGAMSGLGKVVFGIFAFSGAALAFFLIILKYTTELGLTTQRVIYKKGLFFVDVREIDLEEIKSAHIDNGTLGRILNYGYLQLDARFISDIKLPAFRDPYRIIKAMNEVRSKIKEDSMRFVLDQPQNASANFISQKNQQQEYIEGSAIHQMDNQRYKSLPNNPAENLKQVSQEAGDISEYDTNPAPKGLKHLKRSEMPQENKPRHKLFVHVDALRQKVMRDFEKAE